MRRRAWLACLTGGVALTVVYLFGPSWTNVGPMFNLIGASGVAVLVVSARLQPAGRRLPWYLFALGQALFVSGDVIAYNYRRFFHTELPFPAISDVLYLSVYPCLIAGIMLLTRKRSPGHDRASLIDSVIIAVGAGVLLWVYLMAPYAHDPALSLPQKLISISYGLVDLLLLGVAARLAVGGGRREPAFYLLVTSVVVLLVTDSMYGWILLNVPGGYETGGLLDGGWALFYLLWAAAALHPSVRTLSEPSAGSEKAPGPLRLVLLGGAALIAPTVLAVQNVRHQPVDALVIAACSAVLFLLVLARLSGLMVSIDEHRRTERALREAESKFRTMVEQTPVVTYTEIGDDTTIYHYMSPQIEPLLGYPPEVWQSDAGLWDRLIHPEDQELVRTAEAASDRTGVPFHEEYRMRRRDGEWIWVRDESRLIEGTPGIGRLVWQGVLLDVTERKRAELELRESFDRLREADDARRRLLARLVSAQEEERERIAGDIHDDPLQKVTAVGLRLGILQRELSDPVLLEQVAKLQDSVALATARLRALLFDLRPQTLDNSGIADALREYLELSKDEDDAAFGIESRLVSEPPVATRVVAYRIAQEALSNVRKHANAAFAKVLIDDMDGGLFVRIEDDGVGIPDGRRESPPGHLGLSSMRERAEMAGGWIRLRRNQAGGTTVEFWLPPADQGSRGDGSRSGSGTDTAVGPRPKQAHGERIGS